ncbi:Methylthioribulose-1-phosphate dehydratase [Bienertia sinuspersici]
MAQFLLASFKLFCIKVATAQETWDRIKTLFQDNKHTRPLHLSNFPDVSSYCQRLKSLKDQLANVDHDISKHKLVLCLVAGLVNTDYDTIAAMIAQTNPLFTFETVRSKLKLEETQRNNDHSTPRTSFLTQLSDSSPPLSSSSTSSLNS